MPYTPKYDQEEKKAFYFISVAAKHAGTGEGVKKGNVGVLLVALPVGQVPDVLVMEAAADGEDIRLLGDETKFFTAEEMRNLNYSSEQDKH